MNKILEAITTSVMVAPTNSIAISGSSSVDMKDYRNAVAKAIFHRLPDEKGDPATVVLSVYENVGSGASGTLIGASTKTGSLTSLSEVYLETEVISSEMSINSGNRYLGVYLTSGTSTALVSTIERGRSRYDPV